MIDVITNDLLNKISHELNKPKNKHILDKKIITPIFDIFKKKINSYIFIMFILYILNLLLIVFIIKILYCK
jgi:hypothetical protein